eukprot:3422705-Amphidinium_carterae.1
MGRPAKNGRKEHSVLSCCDGCAYKARLAAPFQGCRTAFSTSLLKQISSGRCARLVCQPVSATRGLRGIRCHVLENSACV